MYLKIELYLDNITYDLIFRYFYLIINKSSCIYYNFMINSLVTILTCGEDKELGYYEAGSCPF